MAKKPTIGGSLMFPSRYLDAVDLKGRECTVTIERVELGELPMQGGKTERKPLIFFAGKQKGLVLNKTNAKTIAGLYGGASEQWAGKAITLYPTETKFGKETVDCIRIRERVPAPASNDQA